MIHNGIEYGLMQAYAEGFELMQAGDYQIDLAKVASLWMHGSVVRSWLLELTARALTEDPDLASLAGLRRGFRRRPLDAARRHRSRVPMPVLTAALFTRFRSRQDNPFAERLLAALRQQFGGHAVKTAATAMTPIAEPVATLAIARAGTLVIFGGAGDLAHRKLLPALYNLHLDGLLPRRFAVVGVGRKDLRTTRVTARLRRTASSSSRGAELDETNVADVRRRAVLRQRRLREPKRVSDARRQARHDRARAWRCRAIGSTTWPCRPRVFVPNGRAARARPFRRHRRSQAPSRG